MARTVKRWLLHYYIALQLSAGAVTQFNIVSLDEGPPPIVRPYRDLYSGIWDPREIVTTRRGSAIVTLPSATEPAPQVTARWLN